MACVANWLINSQFSSAKKVYKCDKVVSTNIYHVSHHEVKSARRISFISFINPHGSQMEKISNLSDHIVNFYATQGDSRTSPWFLMDSPLPVFVSTLIYVLMAKVQKIWYVWAKNDKNYYPCSFWCPNTWKAGNHLRSKIGSKLTTFITSVQT